MQLVGLSRILMMSVKQNFPCSSSLNKKQSQQEQGHTADLYGVRSVQSFSTRFE